MHISEVKKCYFNLYVGEIHKSFRRSIYGHEFDSVCHSGLAGYRESDNRLKVFLLLPQVWKLAHLIKSVIINQLLSTSGNFILQWFKEIFSFLIFKIHTP